MARRLAVALLSVALAGPVGCAADDGAQPAPELTTPGAYVGVVQPEGGIVIMRVLQVYNYEGRTVYVVTRYAPIAEDFAEARRLARQPDLAISEPSLAVGEDEIVDYEVLWYRSLLPEEQDGVP